MVMIVVTSCNSQLLPANDSSVGLIVSHLHEDKSIYWYVFLIMIVFIFKE